MPPPPISHCGLTHICELDMDCEQNFAVRMSGHMASYTFTGTIQKVLSLRRGGGLTKSEHSL